MEFSIISILTLFSFLMLFISTRAVEEPVMLVLNINGEQEMRPLLPDLQTRLSFPMKDITEAEFHGERHKSTGCVFWSDKDFTWAGFNRYNDFEPPFPNANRLFCYDYDEGFTPVMVEDMSGNRMLLQVHRMQTELDHYRMKKLKMPLNVRRATVLRKNMACEFRSKESFSPKFHNKIVSEPFREAIEVYCTDL